MNKLSLKEKLIFGSLAILAILASGFVIAKTGTDSIGLILAFFFLIIAIYKTFKDPFWGFSAMVFFLPFERFPTYNLGGIDIKINTVLGFLVLFAWILSLMYNAKKWKIQPNVLLAPIGLFVMALLLSLTQATFLDRSYQVLVFVLFTIAVGLMSTSMIQSRDDLIKVLKVLLISATVVAIFSFFQFAGDIIGLPKDITLLKQGYGSEVFGFPRIQAFSMEPLYLADYLFIPIMLGLAYFFGKNQTLSNRWWLAGLTTALITILVLTVSRGAYLGFAVALLVMAIFQFRQIFTWKHILVGFLAVLIIGGGVYFALSKGNPQAINEFIGHVSLNDYSNGESIQGRLSAFELAYQAFLHHPILGIGLGNYGPYANGYIGQTPAGGWDIVNNEYLEILAETGIVGISAFFLIILTLIGRSFWAIYKAKDEFLKLTLIGLITAMIAILVQYVSFSTLYIFHIWILIGLIVATQNLILKKE